MRRRKNQISRHLASLQKLATLEGSDREGAFAAICKIGARALDVEQVGIWMFSPDRRTLRAETIYHFAEARLDGGIELSAEHYPRYFQALHEERCIAANDVCGDPRTSEFNDDYLVPQGITSMIDVPVYADGRLAGLGDGLLGGVLDLVGACDRVGLHLLGACGAVGDDVVASASPAPPTAAWATSS